MNKKRQVKSLADIDKVTRTSLEEYATQFGAKFKAGLEAIRDAGRLYAEARRKYPMEAEAYFAERYPGVAPRTWNTLERIGNGDLNPSAIYLNYEVAKRVGCLPAARQDKLFAQGVKGFRVVDPATNRTNVIALANMTPKEAELLIDEKRGCVRTVEEQRAVIETVRKDEGEKTVVDKMTRRTTPYRIIGAVVRIGSVELGLETLRAIVAEIESNLGIRR